MKRLLDGSRALVAAAALLIAGCGSADYDRTDIQNVHPSPLGGNMNYARIEVPLGMIVTAHIVSLDEDHKTMDMELKAKESGIVEVASVVSDHDYAFIGLRTGETDVELRANGKLVLILRARVVDQPPLP